MKQNNFFQGLEFSKLIILWAMIISTICIIGFSIGFYWKGILPEPLVTLIGTILTGTVIAYMSKALIENVNKIKNNVINNPQTQDDNLNKNVYCSNKIEKGNNSNNIKKKNINAINAHL